MMRRAFDCEAGAPAVTVKAEAMASSLGGSNLRPGGGRLCQLCDRFLGWRRAQSLRNKFLVK